MTVSHWPNLVLLPGTLREPGPDENCLILWLPAERDGRFQSWQRIATVPREALGFDYSHFD